MTSYRAFSDLFNELNSKLFGLRVYAHSVPSLRQIANVFGITGFHRICFTLTPSQFDTDTFDNTHITF